MNYINWREIDGYACPVNILETNRGFGKTYGWKEKVLKAIKKGKKFLYVVRRPQNWKDITEKGMQIFADINADRGRDVKTMKKGFFENGEQVGYVAELSKAQNLKPASFADVSIIIFDEFLIENDSQEKYLYSEPKKLMNLFDTVARNRNDVKMYMTGNASVLYNPYVLFWSLRLPKKGNISISDNKKILLYIGVNEKFIEQRKNTLAGELMHGTSYEAFALYNQFGYDNDLYIEKPPRGAKYYLTIKADAMMGVYFNDDKFFVSEHAQSQFSKVIALSREVESETEIALYRNTFLAVILKKYYMAQRIRYDSVKTKEIFLAFISNFL